MAYFKSGQLVERVLPVVTSGGTTTLSQTSPKVIRTEGTQSHTIKLPPATGLDKNQGWIVRNQSTGTITVVDNAGNQITKVPKKLEYGLYCADNSSAVGVWDVALGGGADDSPLRMRAGDTPDSKVYFEPNSKVALDGTGLRTPPIKGQIPDLPLTSFDFSGSSANAGSFIGGSFPQVPGGQYIRAGFTLLSSGVIQVLWSTHAASLAALPNPGTIFAKTGQAVGYVDLESVNSSGSILLKNEPPDTYAYSNNSNAVFAYRLPGPPGGGIANSFNMKIGVSGSPSGNILGKILADNSGYPGVALATSNLVSINDIPGTGLLSDAVEKTFTFPTPATLEADTYYWFAVYFNGASVGGWMGLASVGGSTPLEEPVFMSFNDGTTFFDSDSSHLNTYKPYINVMTTGVQSFKTAGSTSNIIENSVSNIPRIWRFGTGGGGGSGSGDASAFVQAVLGHMEFTPFSNVSVEDFEVDTSLVDLPASTGSYSVVDGAMELNNSETLITKDLIDLTVFESGAIPQAEVLIQFIAGSLPTSFSSQLSRDGGLTWQTVTMERVSQTSMYRGFISFAELEAPSYTLNLKLKVTSTGDCKIKGIAVFYENSSIAPANGPLHEVFSFTGTNQNEFLLTKFAPDPYSLTVYDTKTGGVWVAPSFEIIGQKVKFPVNFFATPDQVTLVFRQGSGSAADASVANSQELSNNGLGNFASPGVGPKVMSPDGSLWKISVTNAGAILTTKLS